MNNFDKKKVIHIDVKNFTWRKGGDIMADKGGDRIMELKNRSQYLDKLISVQDMEVIKVVTGIRRCGKSSLLK